MAQSKGQRRSGGNVKRKHPAIIVPAERIATNMREAFLNIKVSKNISVDNHEPERIVRDILTSAKNNSGYNKVGRGWTANLSPKTVRALVAQGVFA